MNKTITITMEDFDKAVQEILDTGIMKHVYMPSDAAELVEQQVSFAEIVKNQLFDPEMNQLAISIINSTAEALLEKSVN